LCKKAGIEGVWAPRELRHTFVSVMSVSGVAVEEIARLDFLHAQARSAYQAYQATRYDAAGRILPSLIRGVETAARTVGSASPDVCAVRARVYDTTAALLSRVGEPLLAWAAADRAMFAAGQSGDPLLAAASAWRLSYMITGRKHPHEVACRGNW
jgi:hypothetical protein